MLLVRKTNPLLTRWLTRRLSRNQEVKMCVLTVEAAGLRRFPLS